MRYDDNRLLIGTRRDGFFLYDGAALAPVSATEFDDLIKATQVYRGTSLPDGSFVITTTSAGFFIMDRQGRRIVSVDRASGLISDTVYFALRDREGALWLGQDAGVTRVDTPSPLSFFDNTDGLVSFAQNMARIDGRLYVAMQSGADYLVPAADAKSRPRFAHITGTSTQCWDFARVPDPDGRRPDALLLACGDGLMEIQGTAAIPIKAPSDLSFRSNVLLVSTVDPDAYLDRTLRRRRLVPPRRRQMDRRGPDRGHHHSGQNPLREPGRLAMGRLRRMRVSLSPPHPRALTAAARVPPSPSKSSVTADGLQTDGVIVANVGGKPLFAEGVTRAALPAIRREDAPLRTARRLSTTSSASTPLSAARCRPTARDDCS